MPTTITRRRVLFGALIAAAVALALTFVVVGAWDRWRQ